ncbi:aldo/keto reductase [Nonomuraea dietziae]|uniref:aldo/keto reductase n=1 Tax=Nonomuraea dietziae TaxID=65515 RepID=UPI003426C013
MAQTFGLTVAAWGPLVHGVLSGKFTSANGPRVSTRVSPRSLGAREHAVAQAVREVADEIGATSARVAIAWTRARSRAVHPILGARSAAHHPQPAADRGRQRLAHRTPPRHHRPGAPRPAGHHRHRPGAGSRHRRRSSPQ